MMWMAVGIISLIIFLVALVLTIIKAFKKDTAYLKWTAITLVFFVLFIVGITNGSTSTDNTTSKTASSTSSNISTKKVAFNWKTAPITEANVKSALAIDNSIDPVSKDSNFPKDIKSVQIDKGNITITYKSGESWDETDLVKRCGGTVIVAGSKLFQNPNVSMITLVAQVDMTDAYGKTTTEAGCTIDLDKATAQKADWKGLAQRHITDPANIYNISPSYGIDMGLYKAINADLKLKIPIMKQAN